MIWALLSTAMLGFSAVAHEIRPAIADVTVTADQVVMEVDVTLEGLIAGIDASVIDDTNDSPEAANYDRLRRMTPDELKAALNSNLDLVRSYFVVDEDERRTDWSLEEVTVPPDVDFEIPRDSRLILSMKLAPGGPVAVGGRAALGPLILRHANGGETAFAGLLSPGELSPPLPREGGEAESAIETFWRYIVQGILHIVPKGLDHIVFVLGLFFFSLAWRPLLWQVTSFTLAHTVTLALASLGIVSISPAIVEPLIAASIVYIAFENLRSDGTIGRWRTAVVFGFGLLHGIGFASVLAEVGFGHGRFLVSLIGFNIGVEIGQLIVIAAAFALVGYWFGKRDFYRPWIANPVSVLIGLIGTWWVIERVFL